jgi:DNA primase
MAKTYVNTVKYIIHVDFEIKYKSEQGKTKGVVLVPSSMDMVETSIMAATIETVEKVGPCEARFKTRNIEDTRTLKRKEIKDRAQALLRNFISTQIPDVQELAEKVREEVRAADVQFFGREKISCGPGIWEDDSIIVVEGRADVITLLRNGVKNVISMGGSKIPQSIANLTKKKTVTIFVDGDRGGELNIRKMMQIGDVDYVARAPEGKEVEELARKEIIMALRRKVPAAQAKTAISGKPSFKQAVKTAAPELGEPVSVTEPALGKPVSKPLVEPSGRMTTRAPARGLSRTRASKPLSRGIRGGSRERKPFGGPPRDYKPGDEPKEEPKAVVSEEDKKPLNRS